jgi:transcriptional regulator with XRE-family HTH domain
MHGDNESSTSGADSDSNSNYNLEPYKSEDVLRELYHGEGLSQQQIAERFDVRRQTIKYWMDKYEIKARLPMDERNPSISRTVREGGRVQYHVPDGDGGQFRFYRHQLVALLAEDEDGSWHVENPFDIISEEKSELVIHHYMNAPILIDIPENLEAMSQREHVKGHAGGAIVHHPRVVLRELFHDEMSEERKRAMRSRMWRRFNAGSEVAAD